MRTAIPAMLSAGAQMVFVTERDALAGRYGTEGILQTTDPLTANPTITRRSSYYAIRALIDQLKPPQAAPEEAQALPRRGALRSRFSIETFDRVSRAHESRRARI